MLRMSGYPQALNKLAMWMVALNPLVKYAVANRPLVQTFEVMVGLTPLAAATHKPDPERSPSRAPVDESHRPAIAVVDANGAALQSTDLTSSAIASESSGDSAVGAVEEQHPPSRFRSRLPTTHPDEAPRTPWKVRMRTFAIRTLLTVAAVALAIVIPSFDTVLSFLGAASAFLICCIGEHR